VTERCADGFAGRKAKAKTLAAVLGILVIGAGMRPAAAAGPTGPRTIVTLRGRDGAGLDALVAAQQDPASPEFRRWVTGSEFGRRFGAAPRDLKRVERWLRESGCRVKRPAAREQVVCVGGPPGDVPAGIRPLVKDVLDPATPLELRFNLSRARFDPRSVASKGSFFLSPDEYAAFFGYSGLRGAGIDGTGQHIGIVGAATVLPEDVAAFRENFDLPPLDLEKIGDAGPATPSTNAQLEAILDVSWAGAVAPGASVVLAVSSGSLVDAIGDLVARPDVSVISLSVVLVPSPASAPFIKHARRLFRQAAARGKTVLIASGDFGPLLELSPKLKRGVDPMTASPFVTAVGGTTPIVPDEREVVEYGSEVVWQDGEAASGGARARGPRPRWQHGRRSHRTVPDVSLPAASIYPIALNGQVGCCIGGTSAAAPSWAGLVAMLNQQRGGPVGLLNPALYALGRAQAAGGPAVFHDIVVGSNGTTLTWGYPAEPGYDLATGWGTPDVAALFAAFP
jgi:subtilase family serine protease